MLFKSVVSISLAALAFAAPHQHHQHKEDKRDVIVTKTNVIVVTVGADLTTTLPAVDLPAPATTVAVESQVPPPPQAQPVSFTNPTTFATVTTAAASPAPSAAGADAAGAKGITYTPYANDGTCKSSSQIASEIASLSGFDIIRLYGVDCNQVGAVLASKAANQKVLAGIYYMDAIAAGIQTLTEAVNANGGWSEIYTVSIGNELVNGGQATPAQVAGYVATGRAALTAAGYSGPVVAIDTFIAVINNPSLCEYSDYIAVNAHAFFDGGYTADQAGAWVLAQIERVWTACGGAKSVFITETGWPSQGESNGVAVPSKPNQEAAVSSIKSSCGSDVVLFTAFNDLWKAPGAFDAEQYWGIFSSN
ncbi:soluble cell wall protein [Scheffersomyces coipomensis]|uniref:soluble cell wall protein n=1 Tax=Scheffersomyces coipomensis TaxID=1788519 RepID=UPI00315D0A26